MTEKYAIGVDLGGTQVRVVLSDENGNFATKLEERVSKESERAISDQIIKMVHSACGERDVNFANLKGVGIASTGPLNLKKGALVRPTNLPFKFVPLTDPISSKLELPVNLINDCSAGVLGEREFGAGRGLDNLAYIALGTGIGGGAIVDGHLLLGKDGNAVEIGHLTIDYTGRLRCGCGRRGHWEAYCSGKNIPNFVRMKFKEMDDREVKNSILSKYVEGDFSKLSSKVLFDAAKAGDGLSIRFVEEIGKLNAIGFANVIDIYDPSLITIGGSVALENQELMINPIKKYVGDHARNRVSRIIITPLAEDAGLYGAIAAVLKYD